MIDEASREDILDFEAAAHGRRHVPGRRRRHGGRQGGLPPLLLDEPALLEHLQEPRADGARDRRDDRGPHARPERDRIRHKRRLGVDPHGRQDRPRPRPRAPSRDHRARDDRPLLGPPGVHEGRAVLRSQGRRGTPAPRPDPRRRDLQAPHHQEHRPDDRVGALVLARPGRPDRGPRPARPRARHQLPRGLVHRRLLPAVRRDAGLPDPDL